MIEIQLASGHTALISEQDSHLASYKWFLQRRALNFYAARFVRVDGKNQMLLLHRAVLGLTKGGPSVDHINGNGLDNTRENLRACTQKTNSRNVGLPKHNTTGYLGVTKIAKTGRYTAQIWNGSKPLYLGSFASAEEANRRRLEVEREMWGVQPRRADAHATEPRGNGDG